MARRVYVGRVTTGHSNAPTPSGSHIVSLRTLLFVAWIAGSLPGTLSAQTFNDVPPEHWAYSHIEIFAASGITGGCGNGNFCPDGLVTRAQMAVFLERSMRGSDYVPPPASGNVFLDIGVNDFAAAFIEQFYADGITGGCGGGNYCPDDAVTRAQMAVFLLRAKYGASYLPQAPGDPQFADVDTGYWAFAWVEQLAAEGITGGCGGGNFCPNGAVTRAQMAVFLVRAFELDTKAPVAPLYATNGANWNDYVADDGTNRFTATDVACDRVFDDHYAVCIHAGEFRVMDVPGAASCAGLEATDALGAFNWTCQDGDGSVRVISSGLKDDANLSDLIDWTTSPPEWKSNSVSVTDGVATVASSTNTIWWSNPITVDNDGGSLGSAGTIYAITANPNARYTIDTEKIGLVIQPGVTVTAPASTAAIGIIVAAGFDIRYLWIEGTIDASGSWAGIQWTTVNSSVLRNIRIANADTHGVTLEQGASGNNLNKLLLSNNTLGLFLGGSSNLVRNLIGTNNSFGSGIDVGGSDHTLFGITTSNNLRGVSYPVNSESTVLINLSTANNLNGITTRLASNNTLHNVAAVNNRDGVYLSFGSEGNFFLNLAASNNTTGVAIDTSNFNVFSGVLKVGSNSTADCRVFGSPAPTDPGLQDGTCANQGASDAALTAGISAAAAFLDKVVTDDTANASDANGASSFDAITDWTSFDSSYRGWGKDGNSFTDLTNREACISGETCRIWDWRLANGDTGDAGSPSIKNVNPLPGAGDTITHTWSFLSEAVCNRMPGASWDAGASRCTSTFLRDSAEILGDGFGNENGLCESNEICLFTPNLGSYQGHGNLISAGAVDGGAISNVTLVRYEINGN